MLSKEEIEKAKERIKKILSCYDEYKKDYEEGHQSSFELDLNDFGVLETLLKYIGDLESTVQAQNMVHNYDVNMIDEVKGEAVKLYKEIRQLEQENKALKGTLSNELDRDKKNCFYEDGNTGKCLGYSNVNDDEPCEYCESCEALSIKGDD